MQLLLYSDLLSKNSHLALVEGKINAKDEDSAMDKARDWKGDLDIDDWEYRDLIESKQI